MTARRSAPATGWSQGSRPPDPPIRWRAARPRPPAPRPRAACVGPAAPRNTVPARGGTHGGVPAAGRRTRRPIARAPRRHRRVAPAPGARKIDRLGSAPAARSGRPCRRGGGPLSSAECQHVSARAPAGGRGGLRLARGRVAERTGSGCAAATGRGRQGAARQRAARWQAAAVALGRPASLASDDRSRAQRGEEQRDPGARAVAQKIHPPPGVLIPADALQCPQESARDRPPELGGDDLVGLKGNQSGIRDQAPRLLAPPAFPPCRHGARGKGTRPSGSPARGARRGDAGRDRAGRLLAGHRGRTHALELSQPKTAAAKSLGDDASSGSREARDDAAVRAAIRHHGPAIATGPQDRRDGTGGEDACRVQDRTAAAGLPRLRHLANGIYERERERERTTVATRRSWCQPQPLSSAWPRLRQHGWARAKHRLAQKNGRNGKHGKRIGPESTSGAAARFTAPRHAG